SSASGRAILQDPRVRVPAVSPIKNVLRIVAAVYDRPVMANLVGMARCAVRAAFSGATWNSIRAVRDSFRPLERGRGHRRRDVPTIATAIDRRYKSYRAAASETGYDICIHISGRTLGFDDSRVGDRFPDVGATHHGSGAYLG